jgi:hypothetical protein
MANQFKSVGKSVTNGVIISQTLMTDTYGTGYVQDEIVTITGSGGSGATGTANVNASGLYAVTVTSGGVGYEPGVVNINSVNGVGTGGTDTLSQYNTSSLGTVLYTCPEPAFAGDPDPQAVIHALYLSNIDGVNPATVDIEIQVGGVDSVTYYHIGKTLAVPEDSTLELDKQVNLMAGDSIKITPSGDNLIQAVAAILEIT